MKLKSLSLTILALCLAVSVHASDACKACSKENKQKSLARESSVYVVKTKPCPTCPKAEKNHNAAYLVGGLLVGGAVGYLWGHDTRKSDTIVINKHKRDK